MLVSIIIPTYNRKKLLSISINSILNQTYKNFEIIIVDDNSNDGTEQYIRSLKYDNIIYIRNENTLYAPKSRNIGINHSKGELIAFLDDDDEWYSDKLMHQIKLFKNEKVGLVYSSIDLFFEKHNILYSSNPKLKGAIFKNMLLKNYIGATPSVIVRKKALESIKNTKNEYFDSSFPARQDYDLWIRICKTWEVDYVKKPLIKQYYRDNINRISSNLNNHLKAHELINKKYKNDIEKYLSKNEKDIILINQYSFLAAQSIKIDNIYTARYYYLKIFKINKSMKFLFIYVLSFLGSKFIILLRKYFR